MRTCAIAAIGVLVAGLTLGGGAASGVGGHEGDLDSSFGGTGVVTTITFGSSDLANAVALQPDGKIVVAGRSFHPSMNDFSLARYRPDGSLDNSFDDDGKLTTSFGTGYDSAEAVTVQPDGKIVAVGFGSNGVNNDFALARYQPDGSLDPSFDGDGTLTTSFGSGDDEANTVALLANGKIVAVGWAEGESSSAFALARYNPDGSLDTDFGDDGKVITSIGAGNASAEGIAVQPGGKIIAAGPSDTGANSQFALARYNANGSLDASFGDDGKVTTGIGTGYGSAQAVAVRADGTIVAVGYASTGSSYEAALARYRPDGILDPDFGGDGIVITGVEGVSHAYAVALQPNGKIVAAGTNDDFALARYNADGSLDTSFGGDGVVTTDTGYALGYAQGVAVQPDGKIVAAGYATELPTGHFAVARYLGDTTAPFEGWMVGLPRYSTTLRATLAWLAGDDNTGVQKFSVRYRFASYHASDCGGYTTFKNATTLPYAAFPAQAGRTYCLSVRATDRAGNTGPYGAESCTAFPVDDRTLTPGRTWTRLNNAGYYLNTARRSTTRGATLTLPNTHYRHLALVASTARGAGTVKVYLGSTLLKTLSLASARTHHRVLFPIDTSVAIRTGTVKIVQAAAGKPVTIDGLATSLE